MASNKAKMLYDDTKALIAPDESIVPSIMAKKANIDAYKDPDAQAAAASGPSPSTSPKDMLNSGAYGSRSGEQRIDTSSMTKPLGAETSKQEHLAEEQDLHPNMVAFHAEGGKLDPNKINVVGEEGPEEVVGDEVIPLDHTMPSGRATAPEENTEGAPAGFGGRVLPNPEHMKAKWDTDKPDMDQKAPMNVDNAPEEQAGAPALMQTMSNKTSPSIPKPVANGTKEDAERFVQGLPGTATPEERSKAIMAPNDGMMKPKSSVLESMDQKSAANRNAQLAEPTPAPPDPNQVIADQHAKTMKAKLDAASKGDLVGMGAAIIAGNALPKPETAIPSPEQGGVVPDHNLGPGAANMPQYTGKERIGAGTPGEMQAKKEYQDKLADLDQQIINASRIHTPEGKQELGYLQSEKAVLQKMNPLGSAANKPGTLGKIEHGLGEVGNVVGNAVLGERNMANIPSSQAALNAANEEGAANVAEGQKGALEAAQTDKAQQPPTVKPQDKLAQEKLDSQAKLGQITQQLQDPKITPEQKAALQQQAEQIYATNPEFRPKPEDQTKQPVGEQGAQQHNQELDAIAQAAGYTPEQAANQQAAFSVKPTDSLAVQEKKRADAESVAKLDSSRRDRETARLAAENARADAKADKQESKDNARNDKSYQYNKTRLDKARKPIDDMAMRMGRLKQTVNENTPLADALVAPELLTAMAGGAGSGLRMNEAEISRIVGGRGHWADLQAAINKWKLDPKAALSITPEQRREIHALLDVSTQRVQRATDIMDEANTALTNANSPEEHRRILDQTQGKISRAEIGKVKVQIPGQPEAEINLDQLGSFKNKYPNATVE